MAQTEGSRGTRLDGESKRGFMRVKRSLLVVAASITCYISLEGCKRSKVRGEKTMCPFYTPYIRLE